MATQLRVRLTAALHEFRREKVTRQNARLSLVHAIYDSASLPRRKLLLSTGSSNYRPPLERSKSAPKLGAIEESIEEEEEEEQLLEGEIDESRVLLAPVAERISTTISDTTSDIVADYDSCSEAASAGKEQFVNSIGEEDVEETDDQCQVEFNSRDIDSLLYCPVPPISPVDSHIPLTATLMVTSTPDGINGASGSDLTLLAKLTRDLSIDGPAEESLTSDQPESLGSQCESCNSSCGGCSDTCDAVGDIEVNENENNFLTERHGLLGLADPPTNKVNIEEGDNISEESGYSEDKEALLQLEAAKL